MKVLLKQARIISPSSPLHDVVQDILVTNGIIESIESNISQKADKVIEYENLHVSIGWMDGFANFADPGYEQKETLETGAAAAAAAGYTDVMLIPDTQPAISSKTEVEYLLQRSSNLAVNIHPIGAITHKLEGKQLAEMYDMASSGAIAFSDGISPVQNPGVLLKALQYVLPLGATVIQMPEDRSIGAQGLMNEGVMSTRLGLPGKPAIAEELMISRDIELLKYTGSRLHITGVSTGKGIELIEAAKKEGLNISCSATPYHALLCDEDLVDYDSNLKLNPPLRSRADMNAIRTAILEGKVDSIASHHLPQHWDDKTCEFEYAKYGMIGLQTVFPLLVSLGLALDKIVELIAVNPRKIFGLPIPMIKTGEVACLSLFDPALNYIFGESMIRSRSRNTVFLAKTLKGKALGIIQSSQTIFQP